MKNFYPAFIPAFIVSILTPIINMRGSDSLGEAVFIYFIQPLIIASVIASIYRYIKNRQTKVATTREENETSIVNNSLHADDPSLKEEDSKRKKHVKWVVIYLIFFAVAIILTIIYTALTSPKSKPKIITFVENTKKSLPVKIQNGVIFKDVYIRNKVVIYKYLVSEKEIDIEKFVEYGKTNNTSAKQQLCPEAKVAFEGGHTSLYNYYMGDDNLILSISVKPADCL